METDNIILEHLRAMRADIATLKDGQREIIEQIVQLRFREHAKDGEILGHHRRLSQVEADVERIKRRLELVDE